MTAHQPSLLLSDPVEDVISVKGKNKFCQERDAPSLKSHIDLRGEKNASRRLAGRGESNEPFTAGKRWREGWLCIWQKAGLKTHTHAQGAKARTWWVHRGRHGEALTSAKPSPKNRRKNKC